MNKSKAKTSKVGKRFRPKATKPKLKPKLKVEKKEETEIDVCSEQPIRRRTPDKIGENSFLFSREPKPEKEPKPEQEPEANLVQETYRNC